MARFGRINKRDSTIVVAASNTQEKAGADYVCPATSAIEYINTTILPSVPAGGRILFLEGTYTASATTESIDLTSSQNGCTLSGVGFGTKFTSTNSIGLMDNFINGDNADNITIENILFANGTGNTGESINVTTGSDFWMIRGNYFTGPWTYGIYFVNGSNANIIGNNFYNSTAQGACITADQLQNSTITGNVFYGGNLGLDLYNATTVYDTIGGNTFAGTASYAIGLTATDSILVHGNTIYNCGIGISSTAANTMIRGNLIKTTTAGDGITTRGYCEIVGNRIEDTKGNGISTNTGAIQTLIEGNKVVNADSGSTDTYSAINLAVGTNAAVRNNYIIGTAGSKQIYGVYVASGVTGTTLRDNTFVAGGKTADISDAGTNTIYYDIITDVFSDIVDDADTNYIVAAQDLSGGAPITCTIANQPDVPRNVVLTFTHPNMTAYNITITGITANGRTETETFTQVDGWTVTGNRAYQSITSIVLNTDTGHGAGDLLDVGPGKKFGLSGQMAATTDVILTKQNGTTISPTVHAGYYTVTPASVAANDDITVLFRKCANTLTWV